MLYEVITDDRDDVGAGADGQDVRQADPRVEPDHDAPQDA